MTVCSHCRQVNPPTRRMCLGCHRALIAPEPTELPQLDYCNDCGALSDHSAGCPEIPDDYAP